MRYTISKTFRFSAAHQLWQLPEGHKCARVHGHDYEVEWLLAAPTLNDEGMVLDYGDLTATVGQLIKAHLDHRCLGCTQPAGPGHHPAGHLGLHPTAENLCLWLWGQAQRAADKAQEWADTMACAGSNAEAEAGTWHRVLAATAAIVVRETPSTTARLDLS